jgi:hypothetical protein
MLQIVTSNLYSILFNNLEVWLVPTNSESKPETLTMCGLLPGLKELSTLSIDNM